MILLQERNVLYNSFMCGINGFSWQDKELLERMNAVTKSRGPDYTGTYFSPGMSLGHLLLAIREAADISRQPYALNPEWIFLFNGQIYNIKQLKKGFQNIDETKADLDTYIVYKTIEQYGWDFIHYIQGMYAIALFNTKTQELRLYRDSSGQKQLYYYHKDGKFIFSSEIKGILEHEIDKTPDELSLGTASLIGYIPGERTIFKHVKKLNPSEYVSWKVSNKELAKNYFKSISEEYFSTDPEEAFGELVSEHLQSKQRVALNLSGGMDSSILLHEMSKAGHEMHTYTTVFEGLAGEASYNRDAHFAKQLAKDYGAHHTEIPISQDTYLKNFRESYETIEEPNFNISLPVYLETAKVEGIHGHKNRVILSGDGGDEIFGGYPHYQESRRIHKLQTLLTSPLFNFIKNKRNHTDYNFSDPTELWLFFRKFGFNPLLNINKSISENELKAAVDPLIQLYGIKKGGVYETMLRDRFLWMPGENFIRSDKLFMSQTLEMRAPFAFGPFRTHIDKLLKEKDYVSQDSNKVFLRNLYSNKLPDYITQRTDKTGWRSPIKDWYDKETKRFFLDIISASKRKNSLIDWQKVEDRILSTEKWPGKEIHLYLSLAILQDKYKIEL